MSSILNRKERRRLSKADMEIARERTEAQLATVLLSLWVDVLWDEGWREEQLEPLIKKVVDRYNEEADLDSYRNRVYEKTGIGLVRTI